MTKFIFETHIPAWASDQTRAERIALWKAHGITHVQLQIDDGRGPTWPTQSAPNDPRIILSEHPLLRAIEDYRANGIGVTLVFNFAGLYRPDTNIKPEYLLDGGAIQMYNMWNLEFVEWRINYILDCLKYAPCDAVGIDYIRTGRWARPNEAPQHQATNYVVSRLREKIPSYHPIVSITNSLYHTSPNGQGVDPLEWYNNRWTDKVCVFNYQDPFPLTEIQRYMPQDLWVITGSYDLAIAPAVPKSQAQIESIAKQVLSYQPEAYGLFTANLFTAEHGRSLNYLSHKLKRNL
jgi:hypothetical protein